MLKDALLALLNINPAIFLSVGSYTTCKGCQPQVCCPAAGEERGGSRGDIPVPVTSAGVTPGPRP